MVVNDPFLTSSVAQGIFHLSHAIQPIEVQAPYDVGCIQQLRCGSRFFLVKANAVCPGHPIQKGRKTVREQNICRNPHCLEVVVQSQRGTQGVTIGGTVRHNDDGLTRLHVFPALTCLFRDHDRRSGFQQVYAFPHASQVTTS